MSSVSSMNLEIRFDLCLIGVSFSFGIGFVV